MPAGQGNDAWHYMTKKQATATKNTPTRTLKDVAAGQRRSVLDARNKKAEATKATSAAAPGNYYDYYDFDQCRENDPKQSGEQYVHLRNHFAFCLVSRPTYQFFVVVDGVRELVGEYTFRLTLTGQGTRGFQQRMSFDMDLDDWGGWGERDPAAPLGISLTCVNYPNAECDTVGGGRQGTIANWQFNGYGYATFFTYRSRGGGDGVHYDQDRVNYHDMRIQLASQEGSTEFNQAFRCDAALYASGGGCIFHEIDATLHYNLAGHGVDAVAAHIKKAQEDPEHVYPGGVGTEIPGGRASGKPLTRLYPLMDAASATYYTANNRIARSTCRTYDPNSGTPGLQCDEYPFRSTWEGANYTVVQPGARWKYSALMIDGTQNGNAGTALGAWYTQDHILSKDAFWVQIDP